jgi:SAM-dependent methyltransferase
MTGGQIREVDMAANGSAEARYQRYVAPFVRPFAEAILDSLPVDRSMWASGTIIDHGAGTGLLTKMLRSRGVSSPVVAIDPSAEFLQGLDNVADVRRIVGTAAVLAAGGMPDRATADGSRFDGAATVGPVSDVHAVVSNVVLHFCSNPSDDLMWLRKVCVPGALLRATVLGTAVDVEPFHLFWSAAQAVLDGAWLPERYPHHKLSQPGVLQSATADAGWVDITVEPVVGVRVLSVGTAWEWLSSVLPVGLDADDGDGATGRESSYRMLSRSERSVVGAEFRRRWGSPTARRLTTTNLLVRATAP